MADYIERSLAPSEHLVARGRWPWLHWLGAFLILLLLGWLIIGIVWFIALAIKYITTKWAVTDHRVILKRGFLTRSTGEMAVENIEAVGLEQGIIGRIFNFGEIVVTGAGNAKLNLPPTADPVAFRRAIEIARDEGRLPP